MNENPERLRHRFVSHSGKEKLVVVRPDFYPGEDNHWPEAFEEFSTQIAERTGGLASLVQADFTTTGPVERAVSHLMAMETFKAYFEYIMSAGCGIPKITLTGTTEDWLKLREHTHRWAEFGLEEWVGALDPVLRQFEQAKRGNPDREFWRSLFRYHSGSGPAVMTGWANVLFSYFKNRTGNLYRNPYLKDWKERLEIDDHQHWEERYNDPQGIGLGAIPTSFTSVPLKVIWGDRETDMQLIGGLMGVTQNDETLEVEPECGWAVVYEEPVDALCANEPWLEEQIRLQKPE